MSDYVIAIRHSERLTYYRDDAGRYWSNADGLKRAERFPTMELARRVVQSQFPSTRNRLAILPVATEMFGAGASGIAEAVPPGSPA